MVGEKGTTGSVTVREADIRDIPMIKDLAERCYLPAYEGIHPTEQNIYMYGLMYSDSTLMEHIGSKAVTFLVISRDGVPSGYCAFRTGDSTSDACIDKIYLLPSEKGHGLGRALMENALERIAAARCAPYSITLEVNRSNPAVRFYEKFGFRITRSYDEGIGNGFYMNAYTMRKEIL